MVFITEIIPGGLDDIRFATGTYTNPVVVAKKIRLFLITFFLIIIFSVCENLWLFIGAL